MVSSQRRTRQHSLHDNYRHIITLITLITVIIIITLITIIIILTNSSLCNGLARDVGCPVTSESNAGNVAGKRLARSVRLHH